MRRRDVKQPVYVPRPAAVAHNGQMKPQVDADADVDGYVATVM
jgi:hypothetical protein